MGLFDNSPVVLDGEWGVAFGLISSPTSVVGRAQGYVGTAATSGKVIRATTYTPQGTDAQRSIKSSSSSDSASGTGAQTIIINYLNTSFQLLTDTVTLNGTTAVNTNATDIAFIESMQVV